MFRACFLSLLFVCGAQDELEKKVEEILPRLSDDQIEARERAVQALVDLGAPALPLLRRRLSALQGETKGRVEEACARIEKRDTLSRSLPPLRKVTLNLVNRPVREALEEVSRITGVAMDLSELDDIGTLTLAFKEATPLQAIDAIARKAGLAYELRGDRRGGQSPPLQFEAAAAPDCPAAYVRHYRVRATEITLTKKNAFQGIQSEAELSLEVAWAPQVRPEAIRDLEISEMVDDQGRSLLPDVKDATRGERQWQRDYGWNNSTAEEDFPFTFPERDAKKIGLLRGSVVFSYPLETKTVTFEKPAENRGKTLEVAGFKVVLSEYQDKNGVDHSVSFEVERTAAAEGQAPPFSFGDIEVVAENGDVLARTGTSSGSRNGRPRIGVRCRTSKPVALKEVRVHCVLSRHEDRVAFELRDIELPR